MYKVIIKNICKVEGVEEDVSTLFKGLLELTDEGFIVAYRNEASNKGVMEFKEREEYLSVRNEIESHKSHFRFNVKKETNGKFVDDKGNAMYFKIKTTRLDYLKPYIEIEYEIFSFNAMPGRVEYKMRIEEDKDE